MLQCYNVSPELEVKKIENKMIKGHDRPCIPLSKQVQLVPARNLCNRTLT